MCKSCSSTLRSAIISHECKHKDTSVKFMDTCYKCFRRLESQIPKCSHMSTINKRELEASGYSFKLFDNYNKQIVFEKSYFQSSCSDDRPVQHFMKLLRDEMVPYLSDKIIPCVPMRITKTEEDSFKAATACYSCRKNFKDIPGQEKLRDHCHVLGAKSEYFYCLDYLSLFAGTYRDACCKSCNRKLVLKPIVNIMVHNLTGLMFPFHVPIINNIPRI